MNSSFYDGEFYADYDNVPNSPVQVVVTSSSPVTLANHMSCVHERIETMRTKAGMEVISSVCNVHYDANSAVHSMITTLTFAEPRPVLIQMQPNFSDAPPPKMTPPPLHPDVQTLINELEELEDGLGSHLTAEEREAGMDGK